MKTGRKLLVILAAICFPLASAANSNSSEWTDYLGNPHRTGYSTIQGPDMAKVLWRVNIPGDFDTSPFIVEGKVLLLWKNSMYHPMKSKVYLLDLLTGDILQEVDSDLFFKAFPVENRILGFSRESIDDLDLNSGEITPLAPIPEKSFFTTNMYPLVLKDYHTQLKDLLGMLPSTSFFFSVTDYIFARLSFLNKEEQDDVLSLIEKMGKEGFYTECTAALALFSRK